MNMYIYFLEGIVRKVRTVVDSQFCWSSKVTKRM